MGLSRTVVKLREYLSDNAVTYQDLPVADWPGLLNTAVKTDKSKRVTIALALEEIAAQDQSISMGAFLEGLTPDPVPEGMETTVAGLRRYFSELIKGQQTDFDGTSAKAQSLFAAMVSIGVIPQTCMDAIVALSEVWESPAQTLGYSKEIPLGWCQTIKEDLGWQ